MLCALSNLSSEYLGCSQLLKERFTRHDQDWDSTVNMDVEAGSMAAPSIVASTSPPSGSEGATVRRRAVRVLFFRSGQGFERIFFLANTMDFAAQQGG